MEEKVAIDISIKNEEMEMVELFVPFNGDFVMYALDLNGELKDI